MNQPQPRIRIDYRDRSVPTRSRARISLIALTILATSAVAAYRFVGVHDGGAAPEAGAAHANLIPLELNPVTPPGPPAAPLNLAVPAVAAAPAIATIEVKVGRNDTLDRIFRRLKLDLADLATIRNLPGLRQSLDVLRPGDEITFEHRDGAIEGLVRKLNETQTLKVKRGSAGFEAQILENPVETELVRKRVRIASSLFESANAAGVSDATALALAKVFGWDIDFVLDIREGDEFTAVYEKIYQDGTYLRDGALLSAEFVNDGHTYRAVRYVLPDGRAEYFTPEGRSMHRAFLRAPVEFTRISSRFNPRRRHPILNRLRAHNGVDYAAPTGTPVRAAGDGRIRFRGTKGGYGRVVVLEHGGNISTLYGHLSRFAKNLGVGSRVKQGQVIGYVGMTGLATGPHLHYEYRLNGVHRNPQTVPLPAAEPIAAELREDFAMNAAPLVAELEIAKSTLLLAGS